MENFFEEYKNLFYALIMIAVGIGCLVYMKYERTTRTEEDRKAEHKYSFSKSTRFNVYFIGYLSLILGIILLLRELF